MVKISIGQYIIKRLKQVGIDTVFGVPGDYNLPLLDMLEDDKDILWGNNANELNAAYAADGYARIKGVGCVVTTFGVGELSAAAGIAGSYAEMIPVIHIVGTPNTKSQSDRAVLHHSLGNGDFNVFVEMSSKICCAAEHLTKENAIKQIDHVFKETIMQKRTGYIGVPFDLIQHEVDIDNFKPLDLSIPKNPVRTQKICLQVVLDAIKKAKHPIIIVDACIQRYGLEKEAIAFVRQTGFPTYAAPKGKGIIPEDFENYRGCYAGTASIEGIFKEIVKADLVIELGCANSEVNMNRFKSGLERKKTISLHSYTTNVFNESYDKVGMHELLPLLTDSLLSSPKPSSFHLGPRHEPDPIIEGTDITHNYFWNKVPEYMVPNSIIISEIGTCEFGAFNLKAPQGSSFISQALWGSIGFTVGAALGAAMADRNRQVYLFCGDGSFQLTCQEVAVMLRHGLSPVIFIINNDGYLIEKLIHGPQRSYNNFQMWEYSKTLDYFGCRLERNQNDVSLVGVEAKVTNREEFETTMKKVTSQPKHIHFIEVVMPQFDAPREMVLRIQTFDNR